MDPITIGLLVAVGTGGAAAVARWRKRRRVDAPRKEAPRKEARDTGGEHRVGDVLLHMGDEYWLAGELALMRDGGAAVRLYSAPERGRDRWLAIPRDGDSALVLRANEKLAAMGWPGSEIPLEGKVLRPVEQGSCAIAPSGEVEQRWEGVGRYAIFRGMEAVALVLEQGGQRLALTGKAIPRRLLEKLG